MTTSPQAAYAPIVGATAMQLEYSDEEFSRFLTNPIQEIELDLSKATLLDCAYKYQEHKRRTNPSYTTNLIYNINDLQSHFKFTLMPSQVNDVFYSLWAKYLYVNGHELGTISTYFSSMKAMLNWATRHKCVVSPSYDDFKSYKSKNLHVYLTPDRISMIAHFDVKRIDWKKLPNRISKDYLEKVRDMFVLSCNLGQRYSDMIRICPDNFDETRTKFKIVQQKCGNEAIIDIPKWAIDKRIVYRILRKYNFHAPATGNIGNYNKAIKFLLKEIGDDFLEDVTYEKKEFGKIVKKSKPLYKFVASHTGRRSFITYHLIMGDREIDIRKCSGHTDGRSFAIYDVREFDV